MLDSKFQKLEDFLRDGQSLAPHSDLFSSTITREERLHRCFWKKNIDQLKLPTFIIPFEGDFETLFADIATFHSSFSPISAYVYVCNDTIANDLCLDTKKGHNLTKQHEHQTKLYLGAILGEAITHALQENQALSSANIGYAPCSQTLSFAISRSQILYPSVSPKYVAQKWALAHKLTQKEIDIQITHTTVDFFEKLINPKLSKKSKLSLAPSPNDLILQHAYGLVSNAALEGFFIDTFNAFDQVKSFSGAFNNRVSAFNSLVDIVERSPAPRQHKSACIAYYCNSILPGSLTHAGLLKEQIIKNPDIAYWYSLYACGSREFDIRSAVSGVCLKLLRDLLTPIAKEDRPSCDISVDELDVLSRVSLKASTIKPRHRRLMRVSLLPGIDIEVGFGMTDHTPSPSPIPEFDQIDAKKMRTLLFEALDLLDKKKNRTSR